MTLLLKNSFRFLLLTHEILNSLASFLNQFSGSILVVGPQSQILTYFLNFERKNLVENHFTSEIPDQSRMNQNLSREKLRKSLKRCLDQEIQDFRT